MLSSELPNLMLKSREFSWRYGVKRRSGNASLGFILIDVIGGSLPTEDEVISVSGCDPIVAYDASCMRMCGDANDPICDLEARLIFSASRLVRMPCYCR